MLALNYGTSWNEGFGIPLAALEKGLAEPSLFHAHARNLVSASYDAPVASQEIFTMLSSPKHSDRRRVSSPLLRGLSMMFLLSNGAFLLSARSEAAFALHDGDRVVFYGDSITQDGGYAALVEEYCRSRFPTWNLRFYNAGVGGDTVSGGWAGAIGERLDRDVIRARPTVVTIMLGMNDGGYKKFDAATLAAFADGYRAIVKRLEESLPGARIYLIRSSPFDDVSRLPNFEGGYMDVLRRLGDKVADIGRENHLQVIDFGSVLASGIEGVFRMNPDRSRQLLPDRVHPSSAGHIVMGATMLRAWQAPAQVSYVEIDANRREVAVSKNSKVNALTFDGDKVTWTGLDDSLPLPLDYNDSNTDLAQLAGADLDSINSEPLVVRGLRPGQYKLKIDDQLVGLFSDVDLANGVNLARYNTPMREQAYPIRWESEGGQGVQRVERQLLHTAGKDAEAIAAIAYLIKRDESDQMARSNAGVPKDRHFEVVLLP